LAALLSGPMLVAQEMKATFVPSALMDGVSESPSAPVSLAQKSARCEARLMSFVVFARRSRTKTSAYACVQSSVVRLVAGDENAT